MLRSCAISTLLAAPWLAAILVSPTVAVETSAQPARVKTADARARSGPGEQFYATQRLNQGELLEIYRRKSNGWCAVRPPDGSYSYVRADHVRPTDASDVLEVTQDGTKTRVGSRVTRAFKVEYVALRKGEHLQLLGEPVRLGKSGQAWYRVAPPAGEFRWVHERDLTLVSDAADTVPPPTPTPIRTPGPSVAASRAVAPPAPAAPAGAVAPASAHANLALPAATSPAPRPPSPPSTAADRVGTSAAASPSGDKTASVERPTPALTTASSETVVETANSGGLQLQKLARPATQMSTEPIVQAASPAQPNVTLAAHHDEMESHGPEVSLPADDHRQEPSAWTAIAAAPLSQQPTMASQSQIAASGPSLPTPSSYQPDADQRLVEFELALSRMVTQEVSLWNLGPLHQQVSEVMAMLPDESGRQSARRLLERVEEFAQLQQRHLDLSTPSQAERAQIVSFNEALVARATPAALAPTLDSLPPDPPSQFLARQAAIARQAENVHYAGQGWLVPVVSSRPDLPRFALTDERGSILAFVSPRPGLNLRRYQRREVGIIGRETMRTDDQAAHLLAERIVVLDRHNRQ